MTRIVTVGVELIALEAVALAGKVGRITEIKMAAALVEETPRRTTAQLTGAKMQITLFGPKA